MARRGFRNWFLGGGGGGGLTVSFLRIRRVRGGGGKETVSNNMAQFMTMGISWRGPRVMDKNFNHFTTFSFKLYHGRKRFSQVNFDLYVRQSKAD